MASKRNYIYVRSLEESIDLRWRHLLRWIRLGEADKAARLAREQFHAANLILNLTVGQG